MHMLHLSSWTVLFPRPFHQYTYVISTPMIIKLVLSPFREEDLRLALSSPRLAGWLSKKPFPCCKPDVSGTGFVAHPTEEPGFGYETTSCSLYSLSTPFTGAEPQIFSYTHGCQDLKTTFPSLPCSRVWPWNHSLALKDKCAGWIFSTHEERG